MIIEKLVCILILILFTFAGASFSLHCLLKDYVMLAPFVFLAGFGIGLTLAAFFLTLFEKGFQNGQTEKRHLDHNHKHNH